MKPKRSVTYELTVVKTDDLPEASLPEVALIGRSNAGKSSLLNQLMRQSVAKVSQTPGKTRGLNFFMVDDVYRWVDFPGYGFAARSGDEIRSWEPLIESYLAERGALCGVILVVDAARDLGEDEASLVRQLVAWGRPVVVAGNKVDRLNQSERSRFTRTAKAILGPIPLHFVSAKTGQGVPELEEHVFKMWVKNA